MECQQLIVLQDLRRIGFVRSDGTDEEEGREKPVTRKTVYNPGGILYN
jgi:hypothetical protein